MIKVPERVGGIRMAVKDQQLGTYIPSLVRERVIPQKALDAMRAIKGDREKSREILVRIGIISKEGGLAPEYQSDQE